jgi:hypothetical protein
MAGKDKPSFHVSHHVNAITFPLIGIIIATSMSFVFPIVSNQNYNAMAQQQLLQQQPQQQQQMQANQTFTPNTQVLEQFSIPIFIFAVILVIGLFAGGLTFLLSFLGDVKRFEHEFHQA